MAPCLRASTQNHVAELMSVDDANKSHVMGVTLTLACGLDLQDAQVKLPKKWALDESYILDVL